MHWQNHEAGAACEFADEQTRHVAHKFYSNFVHAVIEQTFFYKRVIVFLEQLNLERKAPMTLSESGLRNQQQVILVNAARKALDNGRPIDALSLIERVPDFWQQNLITIMGVFVFQANSHEIKKWALTLLHKHLELCTKPTGLFPAAFWIRNPVRESQLPSELKILIDSKRKSLELDWDGIWHDPGVGDSNIALAILAKRPEEVFDANACLVAASQIQDWNPWLARYRALGGSLEDPKYLKIWIARTVKRKKEASPKVKEMLRKYSQVGNVGEVRAFLRHITPVTRSRKGRDPNWELAKYALLVYCGWERLGHDVGDWVHIAKSALYLRHTMVQRIAQRGLAGLERTPSAHRVLEELTAINGEIRITSSAKRDIGVRGNPIWQSVYHQLPIDANARKILIVYSRSEVEAA